MELALPSRSLESAYAAFAANADAVYLGMQKFSARSAAQNFNNSELEELVSFARENNKKVYVTINTILDDEDLNDVYKELKYLDLLGVDAVIIQDLALVNIIRENFPNLKYHCSTQLAVHTSDAVKELHELGFERVVLSRELDLQEIRKIRLDNPNIQIKVFIHGSMCYSFSGLCSFSYQLTNRSANKGSCSQICRTYFTNEEGKRVYAFSMKDLDLTNHIKELKELNIDSLKIEGRMKSPSYAYYCALHYKYLIDNDKINPEYYENMLLCFSRSNIDGYFKKSNKMVDESFSEHKGILLSEDIIYENSRISFFSKLELSKHDGLMLLKKGFSNPIKFSIDNLYENNKRVVKSKPGSFVSIEYKSKTNLDNYDIYLIKRSSLKSSFKGNRKSLSILEKFNIKTHLFCEKDLLRVKIKLSKREIELQRECKSEIANNIDGVNRFLSKHFDYINNDGYSFSLSDLKALKNDLTDKIYSYLDEDYKEKKINKIINIEELPKRSLLYKDDLPYARIEKEEYFLINNKAYIPLNPIIRDEEGQKIFLDKLINKLREKNIEIYLGLNNLAHIRWAKKYEDIKVFIDYFLFVSNRESALFFTSIKNFIGSYTYYEHKSKNSWPYKSKDIEDARVPLFMSLSCYRKNIGDGCKNCNKNFQKILYQNDKKYKVIADNCMNLVIKAGE